MLKHDFAKKEEKKTMLYIFRYFKEIQKGIFVIQTMFEMVPFDWYVLCFFALRLLCHYKMLCHPAIPKQSCRFASVFSTCCVDSVLPVCVFTQGSRHMSPFVWCASVSRPSSRRQHWATTAPLIQLIILQFGGNQMCLTGIDRNKPLVVKVAWPQRLQNMANWVLL